MNVILEIRPRIVCWLGLALVAALLTGCMTPKIDWAARVGSYTYDQSVLEFGPPDKTAKLQDATLVCEWLTRRGAAQTYISSGGGYSPWYGGPVYPTVVDSYSPNYYLRLTFGPDGKLKAWKKYAK